jgi:hypothetical protein
MKRIFWASVVILALAAVVFAIHAGWYWFEIHTGIARGGPDPYYNAWSGVLSDISEIALIGAVSSGVVMGYKKINCSEPTCHRIGLHPTEGSVFHLCRHHHPDLAHTKGRKFTLAEIHAHHHAARGRQVEAQVTSVTSQATDQVVERVEADMKTPPTARNRSKANNPKVPRTAEAK